jgi:glycine/D-amino acid oxidase-like deaminating enzyme
LRELAAFPSDAGALLQNQADFDPTKYLQGLARLIDSDGSVVFENTRAVEMHQGAPIAMQTHAAKWYLIRP